MERWKCPKCFKKVDDVKKCSCPHCKFSWCVKECEKCKESIFMSSGSSEKTMCHACRKKSLAYQAKVPETGLNFDCMAELYYQNWVLLNKSTSMQKQLNEMDKKLDHIIATLEVMPPAMGPQYGATLDNYKPRVPK